MSKSIVSRFLVLLGFCVTVSNAATFPITPDSTFADKGFLRLTVPTNYQRIPLALHVYPDDSVALWTADQSTQSNVISWVDARGASLEAQKPSIRLAADYEEGSFNYSVALVPDSKSGGLAAFSSYNVQTLPTGHFGKCQPIDARGVAQPDVKIEGGKITALRNGTVLVLSSTAAFRYRSDCSLDTTYGVAGKLDLRTQFSTASQFIAHPTGEISSIESRAEGRTIDQFDPNGVLSLRRSVLNAPAGIFFSDFFAAANGILWNRSVSDSCALFQISPRNGSPSAIASFNCLAQPISRQWFGFGEDGVTPLVALPSLDGPGFGYDAGLSVSRLDLTRNLWFIGPATNPPQNTDFDVRQVVQSVSGAYFVLATLGSLDFSLLGATSPRSNIRTALFRLNADRTVDANYAKSGRIDFTAISTRTPMPAALAFTDDNRITANVSFGDGISRKWALGSLEQNGIPRANFGNAGVAVFDEGFRCAGLRRVVVSSAGITTFAQAGAGGSFCSVASSVASQIGENGSDRGVQWSFGGLVSIKTPGLALSGQGVPFFALPGDLSSPSTVKVYALNQADASVPTTVWDSGLNLSGASANTILSSAPGGGFVLAVVANASLKLLRLDDAGKPVPAFGSKTSAELVSSFNFAYDTPTRLLAMRALADGSVSVVLETGPTISARTIGADGSQSQQTIALGTVVEAGASINAKGDAFLATALADGTIRLIAARRESAVFPAVYPSEKITTYDWKTDANEASAWSLIAHPTQDFLYLSARLQRTRTATVADDAVIVRFDLSKFDASKAVDVVAFYNTPLNHYFVSAGAGEIKSVETGGAGPGWSRTSGGFKAFIPESGIPASAKPVCRFYGTPGRGPNSHFYTFSGEECEAVKKDPGWTYEGIAFSIYPPANGTCNTGIQPVYRAYNNGFARNDSNHRYSTDQATLKSMPGWSLEGIVFCSPQ